MKIISLVYISICFCILAFLLGIQIGEQKKVKKVNKIVTVVANPNCKVGY